MAAVARPGLLYGSAPRYQFADAIDDVLYERDMLALSPAGIRK